MGLMRKVTSVSMLGLVSFRNEAERAEKHAEQTRNAVRAKVAQESEEEMWQRRAEMLRRWAQAQ